MALNVSPRNVTGLVDALQTSGFVERRPHPTDRRATLVTLTGAGDEAMASMDRERSRTAAALVADFDGERLEEFRQGSTPWPAGCTS